MLAEQISFIASCASGQIGVLENKKQIAEVDSQISQAELNFKYQELRAPVAGTVFDLKAKNAGFVSESSQTLVKIVPDDNLIAEVFIPNKDIKNDKNKKMKSKEPK